jgi:DnaJ-class molecular chaperone
LEIKEAYDTLKDEDKRRAYDHGIDPSYFGQQRPSSDFSRGPNHNFWRHYDHKANYSEEEINRVRQSVYKPIL